MTGEEFGRDWIKGAFAGWWEAAEADTETPDELKILAFGMRPALDERMLEKIEEIARLRGIDTVGVREGAIKEWDKGRVLAKEFESKGS